MTSLQFNVSPNGIITKSTLLVLGGVLVISGIIGIEIEHNLNDGAIKILLGGFLIIVREYCKTLPNGKGKQKQIE